MTSTHRRETATDVDELLASVSLFVLTAVTAVAMCRVFSDWAFLRPLLMTALVVHVASTVLRLLRVHAVLALPIVMLVIAEVLAVLFYRDTMHWGLPSGDTLQLIQLDLRLVWSQFPAAVAPVPSEGSFLLAGAVGIGLVAMCADAFAFRAYGRAEAVVPAGVLFIFTAALGTDRNRVPVAAVWFAAALMVVAVLRALHGGGSESWLGRRRRAVGAALPATAMCAGLAALGAAIVGPILPGADSEPLLETRQSQADVTEVLSPLVDIRSRLTNRSNTEMFTVSAAAGRYWRVAGLSRFNGTTWGFADATLESADGDLNVQRPDSIVVQQQIRISRLGGTLVPTAFRPLAVSQSNLLWLPRTDTLLVDESDALTEGDVFNIAADVSVPEPALLRTLSASNPPDPEFLRLPDIPSEVIETAREVTATATTPYDQARALQDWFRLEFVYDDDVQRGHSDDAMLSFLRIRRGYCEQFAGTFAVMARALGLPSRVAVGFTSGQLRADGKYHVLGRNAHAWPEVWFDGVGWVLFEPTPSRGAPGSEQVTGAAPAQDETVVPGGTGDGDPEAAPTSTRPAAPTTTERDVNTGPASPTTAPQLPISGGGGGGSGSAPWVLLAIGLIGGWMLWMPRLVRRFTRVGSSPTEQVISAWHGASGALQLAGAPPQAGSTPIEYAAAVEREIAVDHRSLLELARYVTRAIYSPAGVGEPAAMRAAVLRTQLDETSRDLLPWYIRLQCRLDPRLVRLRLVGAPARRRR
jgi:transglutaminase-like putative cysteine protease